MIGYAIEARVPAGRSSRPEARSYLLLYKPPGCVTTASDPEGRPTALDREGVKAKFDVYPEQIIDYLALVGDSADGYPGIARWGAKSAGGVLGLAVLALLVPGIAAVAITVFGALYASALPSFAIAIRHGAHAGVKSWPLAALVLLPLVLTWVCDTAAMAAGHLIGGPKLAPVLSPKKTWAGAIGGFVASVAGALLLGEWVLPRVGLTLGMPQLALVGGAVGVVGQFGDVAESLLKREVGVKDSSHLIPGHGGVLDRLDSLYFVIPVSAGLFRLLGLV